MASENSEINLIIDGKEIIIHNSDFDIAHLNNELSLIGKSKISNGIWVVYTISLLLPRNEAVWCLSYVCGGSREWQRNSSLMHNSGV